jgi:UDPglucose 6-dehydrogenase
MRVSIVGTGYVGLVTGACLAARGHDVVCIDVDPRKVEMINSGHAPIHEVGLPELLRETVGKSLRATSNLKEAVNKSELTFIAVGTPAKDGRIDLSFVQRAALEIGEALRHKAEDHAVVVKSTVIPGTTDTVVRQCIETAAGKLAGSGFSLGMNPEFLTEGTAVRDFMQPDRLVLGGIDQRTHQVLQRVYADFPGTPVILTNNRTAEMIKYASNVTLATMISLANEFARLCSAVGDVDVKDVTHGVHQSAYFTTRLPSGEQLTAPIAAFLEAGCGFGGSCLPKDVTALVAQGAGLGLGMPLLRSVLEVNRGQPAEILRLIGKQFSSVRDLPITVLGLAFKPDTDDVRESPAFPIIRRLKEAGARVTAYDPVAHPVDHEALSGVTFATSLSTAVQGAQVIVIVTRWPEFQQLRELLSGATNQPLVVDGRRVLDPRAFERYEGIGR